MDNRCLALNQIKGRKSWDMPSWSAGPFERGDLMKESPGKYSNLMKTYLRKNSPRRFYQMTTRSNALASLKRWDKSRVPRGRVPGLTISKLQWGKQALTKAKNLLNSMTRRLILAAVLLSLLVWAALALAPQPVVIKVDGQPMLHWSLYRTVGPVLAEAGVKLGPKDAVQPDLTATVTRGMVITVNKAVNVKVNVDGGTVAVQTPKIPVSDVLQAAGIVLGPLDRVNIPLADVVAEGTVITINRVAEKIVYERYQLPVPVERMEDPQMERGESRTVTAGMPGIAQRQVEVVFVDGRPANQLVLADQVIRKPVSRLIAFGTLSMVSRGGNTVRFQKVIDVVATAYSYDAGRYTCTGKPVHFGVVAVDPSVIPLGARLYVEGYGYATADDIGGAIKGDRIDVFFESLRDCDRWGRRHTKVYILS